jgi:hypothetical protein
VRTGLPHSNDPDAPTSAELLAGPLERIDVLEGTSRILQSPGMLQRIHDRAMEGCQVRLLLKTPTPEVLSLSDQGEIGLRVIDTSFSHTVLRADDTMLLILWLVSESTPPPLLHVVRQTDGGLFDRRTPLHAVLGVRRTAPELRPTHRPAPGGRGPDGRRRRGRH